MILWMIIVVRWLVFDKMKFTFQDEYEIVTIDWFDI